MSYHCNVLLLYSVRDKYLSGIVALTGPIWQFAVTLSDMCFDCQARLHNRGPIHFPAMWRSG